MTLDKDREVEVPCSFVCDRDVDVLPQTTVTEFEREQNNDQCAMASTNTISLSSPIKTLHSIEQNGVLDVCMSDTVCSNDNSTHRQYTSLFSNMLPDPNKLSTHENSGDNTQQPPVSPLIPAARVSRSEDVTLTETAGADSFNLEPTLTTEAAAGGEGDTDMAWATECTGSDGGDESKDDSFLETVRQRVNESKCSSGALERLKRKRRNQSFSSFAIDGRSPKRVVCYSEDVVMTHETGSGQRDFHIIERRSTRFGISIGDDLDRSRRLRKLIDIDRGGIYEEVIEKLAVDLERSMALVREMLFRE